MKKRLIALCMAMCMIATLIFPNAGISYSSAEVACAAEDYDGYVYFTVEKSTVGQGLVVEPVKVGYYNEDNLASIAERVLEGKTTYSGTIEDGYYLTYVEDGGEPESWTAADIPEQILAKLTEEGKTVGKRAADNKLGEFDYSTYSGWMFALNDKGINAGSSSYYPVSSGNGTDYTFNDGDVVRLQFTVYGYGQDINACWDGNTLIDLPSKDSLIKAAADYKGEKTDAVYKKAIDVISDWDATANEIAAACTGLTGETATPNDTTETEDPEPVKEPVDVTITMNTLSTTMTLTDEKGNQIETGEPVSRKYTMSIAPGKYVITAYGTDGVTVNGTIGLTITEDESQSFSVLTQTIYCSTKNWTYEKDYTLDNLKVRAKSGEERENITIGQHTTNAARKTFLTLNGDSYGVQFTPIGDKADTYIQLYREGTVTFNSTISIAATEKAGFSVIIPYEDANGDSVNDYELEVGTLSTYYIYRYLEPATSTVDEDAAIETLSYTGAQNTTYFYRVSNPYDADAVTYGNYTKITNATEIKVTKDDLCVDVTDGTDYNKDTVIRDFSLNTYDVADIFLNANERGYINLSQSETYTLYPLRNWLAIEGISNGQVIEPDFHYTVLDENGKVSDSVVTVTEDKSFTTSRHSAKIEAKGEGVAIILVTYDAMINDVGMGKTASADKKLYSAIWPENTGVIVVNVGNEAAFETGMTINEGQNNKINEKTGKEVTTKLAGEYIDAECDVLYYAGDEGAEYTFTPASGVKPQLAAPSISGNSIGYNGFSDKGVTYNDDGSITLTGLKEGSNIVRLTRGDEVTYQVIRAKQANYKVTAVDADGNKISSDSIKPGDTVTITFDRLYHPANKMSGYYNFSAVAQYHTTDGKTVKGKSRQYDFASTADCQKLTFTVPADYEGERYTLSNGVLTTGGFGSPIGDHRSVTYESGKPANFTASQIPAVMGSLPDISIDIQGSDEKRVTVQAYDYTAVANNIEGASKTGEILATKVCAADGETTAEVIEKAFEAEGVDISLVSSSYGSYVESINGLTAANGGGYSGWYMSYNNDDYANWGIDYIDLNDGDVIRFDYSVNPDMVTDDIGNGSYGLPIFTSLTVSADDVATDTVELSKNVVTDENWNTTITYNIDGEETAAAGTKEDPFEITFTLPYGTEVTELDVDYEYSLDSHYAILDGISSTMDFTDGADFSISTLGGTYTAYYHANVIIAEPNNSSADYEDIQSNAVEYIHNTVTEPAVASTGGEWAVIGLSRSGLEDVKWYYNYYKNVEKLVTENGSAKLSNSKSTDNSRVILGLTAIGADPSNVADYNLLEPLADMDYVVRQGINGAIFALIAFDSGDYDIPEITDGELTQTTREGLVEYILSLELENGGWSLKDETDVDITAMAIQALAPYYNSNDDVKAAVDRALETLSSMQKPDGTFMYRQGTEQKLESNCESTAQVVTALSALGINPDTDTRFVKYGNSALDALLSFYDEATHSFCHTTQPDGMATEQAVYALAAYSRLVEGKNSLYDMVDAEVIYTGSVDDLDVTLKETEVSYDGKAKTPKVAVTSGTRTLVENEDYTVSYSNNKEIGVATATVTGLGAFSGSVSESFIINPSAPNSVAAANEPDAIKLTWKKAENVSGYEIYRTTGNGKKVLLETIGNNTVTEYVDYNVKAGESYTYEVDCYKDAFTGKASKAITIVRLAETKVDTEIVKNGVNLTWKKVTGATGYKVLRKTSTAKKWSTIATISKNGLVQYTDKKAKNGVKYSYAVQAVSGSSVSSYKTTDTYFVGRGAVSGVKRSGKAVKITWKKNTKATGYQVQYATKSSFKNAKTLTYKGKNIKSAKINNIKKYRYVRVRSYIKAGSKVYYGAWSTAKKVPAAKK